MPEVREAGGELRDRAELAVLLARGFLRLNRKLRDAGVSTGEKASKELDAPPGESHNCPAINNLRRTE